MEPVYNTLCLAGGASKCIATIGSVYYLQEKDHLHHVVNYIGTSAGALLCYLLVIGYTPLEIIHFLCKSNFIDEFQNLNLTAIIEQKGLINYYLVHEYLEKLTLNKIGFLPTFKDLRRRFGKNLTTVTFNLTKNQAEYCNNETYPDMPCLTALRMSVNVPLLFDRFFYENCEFVDGGLVDNFPILYYDKPGNVILGIDINPYNTAIRKKQGYINYLLHIIMIPYMYFNTQKKVPVTAKILHIDTGINAFDFHLTISQRLNLFSKGYQITKDQFESPKETLSLDLSKVISATKATLTPKKHTEVSPQHSTPRKVASQTTPRKDETPPKQHTSDEAKENLSTGPRPILQEPLELIPLQNALLEFAQK